MLVSNPVKVNPIKVKRSRRTIKGIVMSIFKSFKDLETEMLNDSNFMVEVNKATTQNINK